MLWIALDVVIAALLVWGFVALPLPAFCLLYLVCVPMLVVSIFGDVNNEALVKWGVRSRKRG